MKVCLHVDLDREGNFVQHVGGLVNPTPLVPGARKNLLDGLPEAERAVADRQVGRDLEPTLLDVDEEFSPALCALPHPGLEADQFLLALGGRPDHHEYAFSGRFHPGLQVDPIRPHVYVSPGREVAVLPACHCAVSREITAGDQFGASLPKRAASASCKSPVDTPLS